MSESLLDAVVNIVGGIYGEVTSPFTQTENEASSCCMEISEPLS